VGGAGVAVVVAYLLFLVTAGLEGESFYDLIESTMVINSSSTVFFGGTFSTGFSGCCCF
jgi:hypothetical protein